MSRHEREIGRVRLANGLRKFTQDDLIWNNLVLTRAAEIPVQLGPLGSGTITFQIEGSSVEMESQITISLDGNLIDINVSAGLIDTLGLGTENKARDEIWTEEPALAALVLEHLFTPLIVSVEGAQNCNIAINAFQPVPQKPSVPRVQFGFTIALEEQKQPLFCKVTTASPDAAQKLFSLVESLPSKTAESYAQISHTLRVCSPKFLITHQTLCALQPGNGLLLDPRWHPSEELDLWLTEHHCIALYPSENGEYYTSIDPGTPILPHPSVLDLPMTSQNSKGLSIGDVPVTLSLEMDRIELSFDDLSEIIKGSMLRLNIAKPERLQMLVNGKNYGTAELIRIDDGYGIRVIDLNF